MAITPEDIQPAAPSAAAAPATAPTSAPAAEDELGKLLAEDGEVPEEVLKIPVFNALLEGRPPAIFVEQGDKSPELQTINKHAAELVKAGFGFYKADSLPVNVMFNGLLISPEELAAADKNGTLDQIAAPLAEIRGIYDSASLKSSPAGATTAPAPAPTVSAAPAPSGPPMPASAQRQLVNERAAVIEPGSPTSGPSPGQGRILNQLRKPTV